MQLSSLFAWANKMLVHDVEKTKLLQLPIVAVAFLIFFAAGFNFFLAATVPSTLLSNWSSIASLLSFVIILPTLLWQLVSDKHQLSSIDQAIKDHLKELRRVPSTDESVQHLVDWMMPSNKKTRSLLYVSRLSAIPGFWIRGSSTVANQLPDTDYSNGNERPVHFFGPAPESRAFTSIAELALEIARDECRLECLPPKTRTRFQYLRQMTINDIQEEYRRSLEVLAGKRITVYQLPDQTLEKLSVNFVLRRIPSEFSPVGSPWEMMFFDDADILNGTSVEAQTTQAFCDPAVYMSENAALGYMFRFLTLQATQERGINV